MIKPIFLIERKQIIIFLFFFIPVFSFSQIPNPALIGYFHNWQDANAPYIQLDQINNNYNIIEVSFAIPKAGTDYNMEFVPDQVSQSTFINQIQTLQLQGKKVLISIGGATSPITLNTIMERDSFIASMSNIINTFNFDGMDIDLEGSSLSVSGGTIANPTDQPIINLIFAIKQIMANYYSTNNRHLILTMAPETAFVQGGQSAYGGIWGAYLPVINALKDSIDILQVQLYNSGSMYGIDGGIYNQGTADFIVAMCEAVIQGFSTGGGLFSGIPENKIAVGLPACSLAAGGGYIDTATVKEAINYLRGIGPKPGSYTLQNINGYPALRGMMTWSINWDAVASCGNTYEYAQTYQELFGTTTTIADQVLQNADAKIYPNPTQQNFIVDFMDNNSEQVVFKFTDNTGQNINIIEAFNDKNKIEFDCSSLSNGIYFMTIIKDNKSFQTKKIVILK